MTEVVKSLNTQYNHQQVDMANMKMISPVPGDLRCTTYNAIEAQLKMGANNVFVQLKAYDIQVCI